MSSFCGQVVTITRVRYIGCVRFYHLAEDKGVHLWVDGMFEGLVEEEIIDLTSIVMETVEEKTIQNTLTYGYNLPEGYQFVDENGNVINATKIVLEKKKKEYPKTYEECCEVLGYDDRETYCVCHTCANERLFEALYRLKVCRDAYWKIAGEEMGLGKPWEPDYKKQDKKYIISIFEDAVIYFENETYNRNVILAFPTAEMRDAFKENFDPDIEFCKELL